MRKQILALMDSEELYAIRFMEHLNRKKTTPFDIHAFTDKDKLREYTEAHRVEILLISEHDLEEGCQYPVGQMIVLTERKERNVLYPNICKYQASSQIMKEVLEVYGRRKEDMGVPEGSVIKPPMKLLGVFSPVARCGKTSFSLALGQCLGSRKATLYLNLEVSSAMEQLLGESFRHDLSDVIYYMRRGDRNLTARLLPLIREVGSMALVPSCSSPSEIYNIELDEWRRLFESLRRDSSYEILILDLGALPFFLPELLEELDLIYMPVLGDEMSRAKLELFQAVLKEKDLELSSRIRRIQVPECGGSPSGRHFIQRLPFSSIGQLAEEYISRDQL